MTNVAELPATDINRDLTIQTIRAALRDRSGKTWSVTGGRGTAWGWITITAPPARRAGGHMTEADAAELAELLGLTGAHWQGVSVAASTAHYREYMNRAQGLPFETAAAYWD